MKIQILLALALLFASTASAEVVIYTQTITSTATGAGGVKTTSYTGWLVYDTDTQEVLDALVNSKSKTFYEIGSGAELHLLKSSATAYTLWALVPLYNSGGATFKGTTSLMTLGTANLFYVPKTAAVKGSSIDSGSGDDVLYEFTGTITLNLTATKAANMASQNIGTVFSNLENGLFIKGYTAL